MDEYRSRIEEWHKEADPAVLRELNRRRVAKGYARIRGPRRPTTGYVRYVYEYTYSSNSVEQSSSFFMRVQDEFPKGGEDHRSNFKAAAIAPRVNGGQ